MQPAIRDLPGSELLWRIYKTAGTYPQTWKTFRVAGPIPGFRSDHHAPPGVVASGTRAIYYAASNVKTAVAEVFQSARVIDRLSCAPELAACNRMRPLQLLNLEPTSPWLLKVGAAAALQCGPTELCQAWSRAIRDAYPTVDGLAYLSTMTGAPAYALYERAQSAFPAHPAFRRRLASPALLPMLNTIAAELGNWPVN